MSELIALGPGEGPVLEIFDLRLTAKATAAQTDGRYSSWEGVWQPGGFVPIPHVHLKEHESFYVLEGTFDFRVADSTVRAQPGSFLHVPQGTLHGFVNAGATPARLIFIHAPPLEGFFHELAELSQVGAPDLQAVATVMRRWGMRPELP